MFEPLQKTQAYFVSALLALLLVAIFIAVGVPTTPLVILGAAVSLIFVFRFTTISLYLAIALTPFVGIRVLIPTGQLLIGSRAFTGILDLAIAETVYFLLLAVWVVKVFLFWKRRKDPQWAPRFPMWQSYGALFLAHAVSVFSPLLPDPSLVIKYAFRPVLFDFLAFILLPVNLIHSHRRLVAALGAVVAVGTTAALSGLVSIFFPDGGGFFGRAHPLTIFGVSALGSNHNELAEILVYTSLAALALSRLVKSERTKRFLLASAALQFIIGLLTFARTAWIVFALEAAFLFFTIWKEEAKRCFRGILVFGLLLLPLGVAMAAYSVSSTAQSSDSTRTMLTQIAIELFQSSPWIGSGAGSFIDRVGSTQVFLLEYGAPLDSHGIVQKIGAETGTLGLLALLFVYLQLGSVLWRVAKTIRKGAAWHAYAYLLAGTGGALAYQFFNTDYWSGKMWLPVGLALAAAFVLKESPRDILDA